MTNSTSPLPYSDHVETVPADEYVKSHDYARGEFRVLPNLPTDLAQGLEERDDVFPAVVRFSNAASHTQPDAIPDGRWMAIKDSEVAGGTILSVDPRGSAQDFLMINHPVLFARNVKDFQRFEQVLAQVDDRSFATLHGTLTGGDWNPLHWHWREMLTAAQMVGQLPSHLASSRGKFDSSYQ